MDTTRWVQYGAGLLLHGLALAPGAGAAGTGPQRGAAQDAATMQVRVVSVHQVAPTPRAGGARQGARSAATLVPGTDTALIIHHICVLRSANEDGCVGVTHYAFTPGPAAIVEAGSDSPGAQCSVDPTTREALCAVHQAVGETYDLRLLVRTDPNGRGDATLKLSAEGSYTIEPDVFTFGLQPQADVEVVQSPEPTPIFNGSGRPITETTLQVRNLGPSTLRGATVRETFTAQPLMSVELDEPSLSFCSGGGTLPIQCALGDLAPLQARSVRFQASLPDAVPLSESAGVVDVAADVEALPTHVFHFIHFGRVFVGALHWPSEPRVRQPFDIRVVFRNAAPPTATNPQVVPLSWNVRLGAGLQLAGVRSDWPGLTCTVRAQEGTVGCQTPDVAGGCCSANATLTVLAQRAEDFSVMLDWATPAWGRGEQSYLLPLADEARHHAGARGGTS